MSTDVRYTDDFSQRPAEPRKSGWTGCLIGCAVVAAVLLIILAVAAFWVSRNWRDWAAAGGSRALRDSIDASDFSPEEKEELKAQVDRVAVAFREGRLTTAQSIAIVEKLMESPLMTTILVMAAERQYLDRSGLTEEEKAEGKVSLERFLRGTFDGDIDEQTKNAVMVHIADRQPDGKWQLREQVSDADLRAFLTEAKTSADEAGIPEETEPIDASAEAKRIVDEVMGEGVPAAEPVNGEVDEAAPVNGGEPLDREPLDGEPVDAAPLDSDRDEPVGAAAVE